MSNESDRKLWPPVYPEPLITVKTEVETRIDAAIGQYNGGAGQPGNGEWLSDVLANATPIKMVDTPPGIMDRTEV